MDNNMQNNEHIDEQEDVSNEIVGEDNYGKSSGIESASHHQNL